MNTFDLLEIRRVVEVGVLRGWVKRPLFSGLPIGRPPKNPKPTVFDAGASDLSPDLRRARLVDKNSLTPNARPA